jgi:CrcB protein
MTPLLFVGVALAGGAGAGLRYVVDLIVQRAVGGRVPWGVLVVNLTGAFALGLLTAAWSDATGLWTLGTGFLGGYTTFSAVAVATVALAEDGRAAGAFGYAAGTFAGSVACAALGLALGGLAG